jgi:predicted nucleotidyltransferase
MAVVNAVITNRASDAVRVIAKRERVRAAFLFGSQVEGTADQWSDVDIAVFVEGAEDWNLDRLCSACRQVQRQVGVDIEMHVFPASWYQNPPRASFAQYIIKHGLPLDVGGIRPDNV